jgi:C1A family cysteine protease
MVTPEIYNVQWVCICSILVVSVSEFEEMYLNKFEVEDNVDRLHVSTNAAPTTFDWRDKNVVTPVKNQGNCGACCCFSCSFGSYLHIPVFNSF